MARDEPGQTWIRLFANGCLRYFCVMAQSFAGEDLSRFFKPGRVHRQLYTDPEIFELELERIFGTAWIYVGHESQVKNPGDYFRTHIGRKPVVVVRGPNGAVHVMHNQCAHRGAMVVALDKGTPTNSVLLSRLDLSSRRPTESRAAAHGYPRGFRSKNPTMAMLQVPRVSSYRGFIFANQSAEGPASRSGSAT